MEECLTTDMSACVSIKNMSSFLLMSQCIRTKPDGFEFIAYTFTVRVDFDCFLPPASLAEGWKSFPHP